jgi:hypothetical protein
MIPNSCVLEDTGLMISMRCRRRAVYQASRDTTNSGTTGTRAKRWRWIHDEIEPYEYMKNARTLILIQATEVYYH